MKRNRRSLMVMLAVVSFIGCAAFSCNYHNAVMAEHDFELSVKAFQQIEEAEFQAGNISQEYHLQLQMIILHLAQGGKGVAGLMQSNASKQTVLSEISLIDGALTDALNNGLLGVKNPTTKANLTAALKATQAILANFKTFLGGAK